MLNLSIRLLTDISLRYLLGFSLALSFHLGFNWSIETAANDHGCQFQHLEGVWCHVNLTFACSWMCWSDIDSLETVLDTIAFGDIQGEDTQFYGSKLCEDFPPRATDGKYSFNFMTMAMVLLELILNFSSLLMHYFSEHESVSTSVLSSVLRVHPCLVHLLSFYGKPFSVL